MSDETIRAACATYAADLRMLEMVQNAHCEATYCTTTSKLVIDAVAKVLEAAKKRSAESLARMNAAILKGGGTP